jgi:4-amino-4-deoxy-L-arabinose transferase-like glycosyltransferase
VRRPLDRADLVALGSAVVFFAALALFGARYHWVEEAGTAERDGYVAQAETILAGHLPRDPFRPPLYPLLAAGLASVAGGAFTAARLISNAAAAALAWLAWRTGRRLAGPEAGSWAMALAMVNPNLWILGQHVTTDMLFAALGAAALAAGLAYLDAGRRRDALVAGAALGLAAATRGNALFLLPGLLLAGWLAPGPRRRRLAHLAAAAVVAALALAPVWALRQEAFGSPFHDENWKNLAWKLHGYPDWSYLDRVPYASGWEVVAADPWAVVRGGVSELWRFTAGGGLAQLLGTWAHALLFAAAALWALARRRPEARRAGWLLAAGGLFLAAVAFSFFTWGRFLLLLIPACYAISAISFAPLAGAGRRRLLRGLAAALVLLLAAKTFAFRLPDFVSRHPYREVAALAKLAPRLPPGARLAGTSPFLGRYLADPGRYLYVPDAFGREVGEPALYLARLRALLAAERAAYLVVGEEELRDRPAALAGPRPPAPWLAPLARQGGVTVWRVLPGG